MKNILFILLIFTSVNCNAQLHAQQDETIKYIKSESVGGKLDFTKVVEDKYSGAPFIRYGNTLYNKKDLSILLWGAKVKSLGIESFDETIKLWESINNRVLTEPERKALKTGFEAEL